jgi:hypothetical protein
VRKRLGACGVSLRKPEGNSPLRRPRGGWGNNITIDIKEIGYKDWGNNITIDIKEIGYKDWTDLRWYRDM